MEAKAFKDYLLANNLNINTLMAVSYGVHSRRTHLTYKRILNGCNVGVLPIKSEMSNNPKWWTDKRSLNIMADEYLSFWYAWFLVW
ncbi:MAG: hypothetical protein HC896_11755 [Bacteroidales bacterium]|nr:hypothetical protein [Bacteroidales bacterium]